MGFWQTLFATLLGVTVAGAISFLNTQKQLRHDAEQRDRDRKMNLRRDVYLEAAEAIGRAQGMLASFSRDDLSLSEIIDIAQENPGALNKAQIVADEETVKALVGFGKFVTRKLVDLLTLRLALQHIREELSARRENIAHLEAEQANLASAFRGQQIRSDLVDYFLLKFRENGERLQTLRDEIGHLLDQESFSIRELGRATVQTTLESQVEVGKINIAIRREVEMPLDSGNYLALLKELATEVQPEVDRAYAGVDKIFEEKPKLGENG